MSTRKPDSRRRRALRQLAMLPAVWLCVGRITAQYSLWAVGVLVRQVISGKRSREEDRG